MQAVAMGTGCVTSTDAQHILSAKVTFWRNHKDAIGALLRRGNIYWQNIYEIVYKTATARYFIKTREPTMYNMVRLKRVQLVNAFGGIAFACGAYFV